MARRDEEPVFIAEFDDRDSAELAWTTITDTGIAAAVITDNPPWGAPIHRIQVERRNAPSALESLKDL